MKVTIEFFGEPAAGINARYHEWDIGEPDLSDSSFREETREAVRCFWHYNLGDDRPDVICFEDECGQCGRRKIRFKNGDLVCTSCDVFDEADQSRIDFG